jgi:hypothetical protein
VLEGSVRKSGNRVRITAQLIDARSDVQVWSETYDRTIDDVFAVQDEIAAAVASQCKEPVLPIRQLGLALAYSGLGRKRESDVMLGQLEKEPPDCSIAIAEVYAYRADADAAFRWLARGFEERDPGMTQMRSDSMLKPLHGDPRWGQMLDRIGLSDEQVAALTLEVELP